MKFIILAITLFFVSNLSAQKKYAEVYQKDGAAIGGYDPVAFFTEQKPVKGSEENTTKWKDAEWRFASRANLESFIADPEKYAPQYGGYCAYGAADGHKAPTKVETWTILNEKLFFNFNQQVKNLWDKDRTKYIEQADSNWEKIKFKQ